MCMTWWTFGAVPGILLRLLLLMTWSAQSRAAAASGCPALDDPSLRHFDVRLPALRVPHDTLTAYVCQVIKIPVPVDQDFHAVAFQPLIDNHDVMHHMIVFTCDGHDEMLEDFTRPHSCSKADNICRSWMVQWSRGVEGTLCPHGDTGVRFGRSLGPYLLIQVHWNNAHFRHNMTDSSGMRVFYTPRLRPHDLGHVQVGQQDVVIPPRVTRHAQTGGCSGECTQMLLPHPIHLTSSHLHMHYLGAGGWLEVIHSDGNVTQVTYDDSYDFNHPPVHHLPSPVTVWPGDSLRLTCLFSSKEGPQQRNRTVYFGEGSDGEMCYAFLAYFPNVPGFDQCLQLGSLDLNCHSPSNSKLRECSTGFLSLMASQFIPDVLSACTTSQDTVCQESCQQSLDTVHSHHCMQGSLGNYMEREALPSLPGWTDFVQARDRFTTLCGTSSLM